MEARGVRHIYRSPRLRCNEQSPKLRFQTFIRPHHLVSRSNVAPEERLRLDFLVPQFCESGSLATVPVLSIRLNVDTDHRSRRNCHPGMLVEIAYRVHGLGIVKPSRFARYASLPRSLDSTSKIRSPASKPGIKILRLFVVEEIRCGRL